MALKGLKQLQNMPMTLLSSDLVTKKNASGYGLQSANLWSRKILKELLNLEYANTIKLYGMEEFV